jgi:hypothetical protein
MHETPGLSLRALIAALLAAGLVGLFGFMLIGGFGTADSADPQFSEAALPQGARYPMPGDKFAPGRLDVTSDDEAVAAYPALCHGEGLLDPANQNLLLGDNQTVAQYCEPKARSAGGADAVEPGTDSLFCQGEGLIVPMDPAAQNEGPGSLTEFCMHVHSDDAPSDGPHFPSGIGLTEESDY